jgi:hypothetical protein
VTTLRDVLEQEDVEFFWVKRAEKWELARVGRFGIFETWDQSHLDYLDYADCPAIKIEEPKDMEDTERCPD